MYAKILGFDSISFTDTKTGEVIEGKKVYYVCIPEADEEPTAEYGDSCAFGFFKNCPNLTVGVEYGISLKAKKTSEGILYKPTGFYPISD